MTRCPIIAQRHLSSDQGSDESSYQSTMMRGSRESNQAGRAGRVLRVKVKFLIFKDEKTKDAVTYCSWWQDIAIFCCLCWYDHHLLPYIFWSLQGFLGDLARSLGKDATLTVILQMLDEHYGVVMTVDALSKELYSLKQGSRRIWLSSECTCHSRFRYSSQTNQEGFNMST